MSNKCINDLSVKNLKKTNKVKVEKKIAKTGVFK